MQLSKHHKAWLDDHPGRSEKWLRRMIAEGFEVHHIDGNHTNNHSKNLVLVEVSDHHFLHGFFGLSRLSTRYSNRPRRWNNSFKPTTEWLSERGRKGAQARWSKA